MMFKNLEALMPEIKQADVKYQAAFEAAMALPSAYCGTAIVEAATEYNSVLLKAVQAIWEDTSHVNNKDTIFSVYGRVQPGFFTLFGHEPYSRLLRVVETDSLKGL